MSDMVIRADGLGKRYRIRRMGAPQRDATMRDAITRQARGLVGALAGRRPFTNDIVEDVWALRDVGFEIGAGEVVGVVGRNGAGKSTLLKLLSRITEPTAGRAVIDGRVASLLEVGTGFHPELTGRENVFLNGAIVGMTRAEIARRFDEIVDFAAVERFIDTPVKRYSSGMQLRLAFAVAAHLEADVLIIDEVLAVGDAEFRRKCLDKIGGAARQGRCALFVSHNLGVVSRLCPRSILLDGGRVVADGPTPGVLAEYTRSGAGETEARFATDPGRPSITSLRVDAEALSERSLLVEIGYESPTPMKGLVGGIVLRGANGEPVWGSDGAYHGAPPVSGPRRGVFRCECRDLPLVPGEYSVTAYLGDWHELYDTKPDVLKVQLGEDEDPSMRQPPSVVGYLDWPASWRTAEGETDAG